MGNGFSVDINKILQKTTLISGIYGSRKIRKWLLLFFRVGWSIELKARAPKLSCCVVCPCANFIPSYAIEVLFNKETKKPIK